MPRSPTTLGESAADARDGRHEWVDSAFIVCEGSNQAARGATAPAAPGVSGMRPRQGGRDVFPLSLAI